MSMTVNGYSNYIPMPSQTPGWTLYLSSAVSNPHLSVTSAVVKMLEDMGVTNDDYQGAFPVYVASNVQYMGKRTVILSHFYLKTA